MLPTFSSALSTEIDAIFDTRDGMMPCHPNRPSCVIAGMTCTRRGRYEYRNRSPGIRTPWNRIGWNSMITPVQLVT
jgi:hypothetical protein